MTRQLSTNDLFVDRSIPRDIGVLGDHVRLDTREGVGCTEYCLSLNDEPFTVNQFHRVLEEVSPDTEGDYPDGINLDWADPDRVNNPIVSDRVSRHSAALLENWDDFLQSRQPLMELMARVPQFGLGEQPVRRLEDPYQKALFCARFLTGGGVKQEQMFCWDSNGLENGVNQDVLHAVFERVDISPVGVTQAELVGLLCDSEDKVPNNGICDALVDVLRVEPSIDIDTMVDAIGSFPYTVQERYPSGKLFIDQVRREFLRAKGIPPYMFRMNYAVEATYEGARIFTPYMKSRNEFLSRTEDWVIPTWARSETVVDEQSTYNRKRIIRPEWGELRAQSPYEPVQRYAVDDASIISPPHAPRILPEIQWRKYADGKREFLLKGEVYRARRIGNVVCDTYDLGLFGVILAAYLQPDRRMAWPKKGKLEGPNKQRMGMAQMPVLALMDRNNLVNSDLFSRIESF